MASTDEGIVVEGGDQVVAGDVLASLLRASRRTSAEELPGLVAAHARRLGLGEAGIWLVEHGQRRLVLATSSLADPEIRPVDGSAAGDCFRQLQPVEADGELWLPLIAGAERLGVLQLPSGAESPPPDLDAFAVLVGELVSTRSLYSDRYFQLRRRERMSLEAELQWSLLPPLSSHCGGASLAGLLEPAYDVGGDTFDHALNDGVLHLAVFDAIGHDVGASIVSHVVLGTYRHARRLGNGLATTATVVDAAVSTYVGDSLFATGVLAQLDCATGVFQWLGIGHPRPLLLRGGEVVELTGPPSRPLGLGIGSPHPELLQLQAGDRVLLYTDGVVDERIWDQPAEALTWLGERLIDAADSGLQLEEILRMLMLATIDRWQGRQRDDATLLLVEWSPS